MVIDELTNNEKYTWRLYPKTTIDVDNSSQYSILTSFQSYAFNVICLYLLLEEFRLEFQEWRKVWGITYGVRANLIIYITESLSETSKIDPLFWLRPSMIF